MDPSPNDERRDERDPPSRAGRMRRFELWLRMRSKLVEDFPLALWSYAALVVLFTWPAVTRFTTHYWGQAGDLWIALWDVWWFERVVSEGEEPLFTHHLFHPIGVSLSHHSISWLCSALAAAFRVPFGKVAGYNLMTLSQTWLCAMTMFALARYVTKDRTAAWLAGAIFAFDPFRMSHALQHPNLASTGLMPLVLLCVLKGARNEGRLAPWLAGLALAFVLLTGVHLFAFTLLAVGVVFLGEGWIFRRFRDRGYWRSLGFFALASAIFAGPFLLPYVASSRSLAVALRSVPSKESADLLAFFAPGPEHLVFGNENYRLHGEAGAIGYLGIVPLLLVATACWARTTRREATPWVLGVVLFLTLSLGPRLLFDGKSHDVWLPYRLIADLAPIRALRDPERFNLVARPLFAVGCAFGFMALRPIARLKRAELLLLPLVLIDYLSIPTPIKSWNESKFYRRLGATGGSGAILELPLTRSAAKAAMFGQTVHERPLVGGMVARTPPDARAYIRRSPLLAAFEASNPRPLDCRRVDPRKELGKLQADSVEYIVIRRRFVDGGSLAAYRSYFPTPHTYQDRDIIVYSVSTLLEGRLPCDPNQ
jgi:hypothetical protein